MKFFNQEKMNMQEQERREREEESVKVTEIKFDKENEVFDGYIDGLKYYRGNRVCFYAYEDHLRPGEYMIDIRHEGPTESDDRMNYADMENVEEYKRLRSEAQQKILEAIKNYQVMQEQKKSLKDMPSV